MEDIVEFKKKCCLCLNSFTDPRILPCLHTFCLKCLEKTGVMKPEQQMPCPACGSEFTVPLEGLGGLPRNLLAENVIYDSGNAKRTAEAEFKPLCNICTAVPDKKGELAERYCIICEEKLCLPCAEEHSKQNEHLVVALKTKENPTRLKKVEGQLCLNHQTELANMYCTYCKKVVCTACLNEDHKSHDWYDVTDAVVSIGKLAEKEFENISEMRIEFQQSSEKLQREKNKFLETVKQMETEILRRCEEIKELVFTETKALLLELDVLRKERLEEIEMEQRRMEKHVFTLEKFKEYCAQINGNTSASHTCESEGALRSTAKDLKTQQQSRIQSRILQLQVSYQKSDTEKFMMPLNSAVGKITVKCRITTKLSSSVDTSNKTLYGMAYLQGKLYVLADSILIHRAQRPFNRVGEIRTTEIKSPTDIVSCPKTSCLYIHDSGLACIWKVTIPNNEVRCWWNKVNQPCAMTVSSSTGEVLFVRNNTGAESSVTVEIYNQNGIFSRNVHLPKTVKSLLRVFETQSGSYIGLGNGNVYKFRADGSIIAEFEMSKRPECYSPARSVALSPYRVFLAAGTVALKANSKISLLGLDLEWDKVLVSVVCGENLCYLKETKQLVVREAQVISIYDVLSL